jgi:hypothetical protein
MYEKDDHDECINTISELITIAETRFYLFLLFLLVLFYYLFRPSFFSDTYQDLINGLITIGCSKTSSSVFFFILLFLIN